MRVPDDQIRTEEVKSWRGLHLLHFAASSCFEIAWFISLFRLGTAGHPLERHSRLRAHYLNLRERPAFAAEVRTPGLPGMAARLYGGYRRLRGTTLGDLLAAG